MSVIDGDALLIGGFLDASPKYEVVEPDGTRIHFSYLPLLLKWLQKTDESWTKSRLYTVIENVARSSTKKMLNGRSINKL